jgi:hypothetical protein
LQQAPGVQVDRINVGGNQSGQQSRYLAKGSGSDQNTWNIDGVNITDMAATGASPTYYDFDSFEEMQVTTGGSDPRIMTPGVQLNMVTKRGTNDIRGSGRYFYTPGSQQAEASVPAEALSYLVSTNRINYVRDYGVEVGGPIWKDRVWIWYAGSENKISNQGSSSPASAGTFDNIILRSRLLLHWRQSPQRAKSLLYPSVRDRLAPIGADQGLQDRRHPDLRVQPLSHRHLVERPLRVESDPERWHRRRRSGVPRSAGRLAWLVSVLDF